MSFIFMADDIPIVYYGQEQSMHGNSDPPTVKRCGHLDTISVRLIAKLNTLRQWMIKTDNLPNAAYIHLVDHNNLLRHSEGICYH